MNNKENIAAILLVGATSAIKICSIVILCSTQATSREPSQNKNLEQKSSILKDRYASRLDGS